MPTSEPNGARAKPSQPSTFEADIGSQLRELVRSVEPSIVFSSLAYLCVPNFSDVCTVGIVEENKAAYQISYPRSDLLDDGATRTRNLGGQGQHRTDHRYAICTRFDSVGYRGLVTHLWRTRAPTPAEASRALILVRHGVDTVQQERDRERRRHDTTDRIAIGTDVDGDPDSRSTAGELDPAVAAFLQARARRLRYWARCETQHIAGP